MNTQNICSGCFFYDVVLNYSINKIFSGTCN